MTTIDILKNYFKNEFANRRAELGLSQEEMAEISTFHCVHIPILSMANIAVHCLHL